MAHNWQNQRWRRVLMQLALILLLAGTVGLAAWVSHGRGGGQFGPLTQTVDAGPLRIRLPRGWAVAVGSARTGLLLARPPADEQPALRLTARLLPVPDDRSAAEFLLGTGGLLHDQVPASSDDDASPATPGDGTVAGSSATNIAMGSVTGVMVKIANVEVTSPFGAVLVDRWFACGIFTGAQRQALVLELAVPHAADDPTPDPPLGTSDEAGDFLRAIAATARLTYAAPTDPAVGAPI